MTGWMTWVPPKVEKIVKSGGHDKLIESNAEFKNLVKHMTMEAMLKTGMNTMIGYEGTDKDEDCILWLNLLLRKVSQIT